MTPVVRLEADIAASAGSGVGNTTAARPDGQSPGITLSEVRVEIGDRRILDAVSARVAGGSWTALIGPNGAGKSTLLRALIGLIGYQGEIVIDGLQSVRPRRAWVERSRLIGYVPQTPVLPEGMTVSEYVLLGRTAHLGWLRRESSTDRALAAAALHRLDLVPFAHRSLQSLSGGEVQRVTLARVLAAQCSIIVLDEPTSALDLGHQMAVLELVDELRHDHGLTVIAAMHDLTAAARFADSVLLLSGGQLLAAGPPDEVLNEQALSSVYRTAVTVMTAPDGSTVIVPVRATAPRGTDHVISLTPGHMSPSENGT